MEKEAYLLDVDYVVREGEPVLRLFLSDGNDPLLGYYEGFSPYFYVVPGEGEEEELEDSLLDLEFEDGDDRVKVTGVDREVKQVDNEDRTVFKTYVNLPVNVPKVKDRVKEWDEVETKREFDIPFYKRFLVDKGLKPGSSVKVEGDDFEPFDDEQDSPALQIDRIEQSDEKDIFETEPLAFDLEVLDDEIIMCSFFSQGFRKVLVSYDFEFDAS
ncbi:MAG: hypothetical protein MUP58_02100, partial [Candidatus Nanohaloarchaeota archaeon QJJ-9]|nr:hypothetical protein [Candidatus Nanohaloarchaeota archaeon QJJ-9]